MPYIKKDKRYELDSYQVGPQTAGEINYTFTRFMLENRTPTADEKGAWVAKVIDTFVAMLKLIAKANGGTYQNMNDAVGALYLAAIEYQRRTKQNIFVLPARIAIGLFYTEVVASYEDKKIEENGDIYA